MRIYQDAFSMGRLSLDWNPRLSRIANVRRHYISKAAIHAVTNVLEIGAADNPTVDSQEQLQVRYADYISGEELKRKYVDNPRRRPEKVVDVDFVIEGPVISEYVSQEFDLIIANHVFEHLPNPIGWLNELLGVASSSASLFLAIPDQRYTFDYLKRPTDAIDLLRAFDESKQKPDAYDVARNHFYHMQVDLKDIWSGGEPGKTIGDIPRNLGEVMANARRLAVEGYQDVHCAFYTCNSFKAIWDSLYLGGYGRWRISSISEVIPDGNEFYVVFQQSGEHQI